MMEPRAGFQHILLHSFSEIENRFQIHFDHQIPHLLIHSHQQGIAGDSGIIDQHIHLFKIGNHLVNHLVSLIKITGIAHISFAFYTQLGAVLFPEYPYSHPSKDP